MAETNASRLDGDTFQARMFWLHATRLLDPDGSVIRLGYEMGPKAFDDIWVEHDRLHAPLDQYERPLLRVHFQCKWHTMPGQYGHGELVDPDFINANAVSFLQRAAAAGAALDTKDDNVRFGLLTNWRIDREDPLKAMIGTRSGAFRRDRLFRSKTDDSKDGRVRKLWREHLELDDDQLGHFVARLKFSEATDTLDELRERLDERFAYLGLRRFPPNELCFPYDTIIQEWMVQGRKVFDRDDLRRACDQQGLLTQGKARPMSYGVKSFEHPIDPTENRCTKLLDLTAQFDERFIKDQNSWRDTLYPELAAFLTNAAANNDSLRLVLDAHASLAFAAGSVLNIKSGKEIELEQRTLGREIWRPGDSMRDATWSSWDFEWVAGSADCQDVVVAVGLTHDISADVAKFVEASKINAGKILIARPSSGVGPTSVVSGQHAFELAGDLVAEIRKQRSGPGQVHLFIAAPNTFTFFLGQRRPNLGTVMLYEFDFEGQKHGTYAPSLRLPV